MRKIFILYVPVVAIIIFPLTVLASDNDRLKTDAIVIINIIKKSSEPDIYSSQIISGIRTYKAKLLKYSNEDVVYISKICKSFINLELAVWDGFIKYYTQKEPTASYAPNKDPQVKRYLNELKSYRVNLQMEQEIDGAVAAVEQIRLAMPASQFRDMLFKIRRMMWSDYMSTYNAIFD